MLYICLEYGAVGLEGLLSLSVLTWYVVYICLEYGAVGLEGLLSLTVLTYGTIPGTGVILTAMNQKDELVKVSVCYKVNISLDLFIQVIFMCLFVGVAY